MADMETALNKLLDRIIDEPYKSGTRTLTPLTSEGANYTSALFNITITANNESDLKLFAKIANVTGHMREIFNVGYMFETEQFVFNELEKIYEIIQDKHKIAQEYRFTFPKYYGGEIVEGQEKVVFGDLTVEGYRPYSRFESLDWEHAASAVESLARFHALSFAFQSEDPVNFAVALEKLKFAVPEYEENLKEAGWKILDGAIQVTKSDHKEAIKNFLLSKDITQKEIYQYRLPITRPVICHGDYRVSNLMFRRQNEYLEALVIDYQTCHPGSATADLTYLEFTSTDENFRQEYHQMYIDHYYNELTLALNGLDLNIDDVYPREIFHYELQQMLPVMLRLVSSVLPMVLVEPEHVPQLGKDGDLGSIVIKPNKRFAERYNGLVNDCVRWRALKL